MAPSLLMPALPCPALSQTICSPQLLPLQHQGHGGWQQRRGKEMSPNSHLCNPAIPASVPALGPASALGLTAPTWQGTLPGPSQLG